MYVPLAVPILKRILFLNNFRCFNFASVLFSKTYNNFIKVLINQQYKYVQETNVLKRIQL